VDALSPRVPSPIEAAITLDAIKQLQQHPDFAAAVMASARVSIELYHGGRLMNWIMSDRARALLGYMAYYLEVAESGADPRSGLTPTKLKQRCAESGLCSPGRAGAMLALMRGAGYVALVTDDNDKRVRRLVATSKLKENLRTRLTRQLDSVASVIPDVRDVVGLLGREDFERALIRQLGDQFIAGFRILMHAPELALFAEHNAGMVILFNLMLASTDGFPPRGPVPSSIAGLARRFGVSRTHVLRLLRAAEAEGLIKRTGEHYDRLVLPPHLTQAVFGMFATIYLYLAHCARAAKADVGVG
jgi:DNA-binding MarR family transcriptional regulator